MNKTAKIKHITICILIMGGAILFIDKDANADFKFGTPTNLGPPVSTPADEGNPHTSPDGLALYFSSGQSGGSGGHDLYVARRETKDDNWGTPVNLGTTVNSPNYDGEPDISSDGLCLVLGSDRPGGSGGWDLWITTRKTKEDPWDQPVNLGPEINSSRNETMADISGDGSILFFASDRSGNHGVFDIWQVPIIPIVDLNTDGIVDSSDMGIMVDHWGEDYSLCDIGPTPWGDGVVDVEDLIVLAEHFFEEFPPVN